MPANTISGIAAEYADKILLSRTPVAATTADADDDILRASQQLANVAGQYAIQATLAYRRRNNYLPMLSPSQLPPEDVQAMGVEILDAVVAAADRQVKADRLALAGALAEGPEDQP